MPLRGFNEGFTDLIKIFKESSWQLCWQKNGYRDFPGGPVVQKPPYNAECTGLTPDRGTEIPRASEQVNLGDTAAELVLESELCNK